MLTLCQLDFLDPNPIPKGNERNSASETCLCYYNSLIYLTIVRGNFYPKITSKRGGGAWGTGGWGGGETSE